MIRVAGPLKAFVAPGEGLVDQDAAFIEGGDNAVHQRPIEVIDDDDAGERPPGQRPALGKGAGAGFQVGLDDLCRGLSRCFLGQVGHGGCLLVHHHHRVA